MIINDGSRLEHTLQLSAGAHSLTTDGKLQNIAKVIAHADGSTLDLTGQAENYTIDGAGSADVLKGGGGDDIITGKAGGDTLEGGSGNDTFKVDSGSDIINDLGGAAGGQSDILIVDSGATATASNIKSFTAGSTTKNLGTATLNSKAGTTTTINMSSAGAGNGFTLGGNSGVDTPNW